MRSSGRTAAAVFKTVGKPISTRDAVCCQGSWAAALHAVLLAGTALVTLGALPLLYLTASWYLSAAAPPEAPASPSKAPRKPVPEAPGNGRPPAVTISQRLLPGVCARVLSATGACNKNNKQHERWDALMVKQSKASPRAYVDVWS